MFPATVTRYAARLSLCHGTQNLVTAVEADVAAFDRPRTTDFARSPASPLRQAEEDGRTGRPPLQTLPTIDLSCLATPNVLAHVRTLLEFRFADWRLAADGFSDFRENLLLIADELVTNAVTETPESQIRISCRYDHVIVTFAVWDSSFREPTYVMPQLDAENLDLSPERFDANGGWGLTLVRNLASDFGVSRTSTGKWVWAEMKVGYGH